MTFIPSADVDPSIKPELEETAHNPLDALATSTGPQKNGKGLLQPFAPVIFVEATESSLGTELDSGKYKPINVPSTSDSESRPASVAGFNKEFSPIKQAKASTSAAPAGPLDTFKLTQKWTGPPDKSFRGLDNLGNSCFMNSTLQILLHTTPLFNVLWNLHQKNDCPLAADGDRFCFACALKSLAVLMLGSKSGRSKSPEDIFANLRKIAPSFRRGRQEDAHEFLRFSIDALQLSAQKGVKDVPEKLAETSWVYRLFGGKFRSRVGCSECSHNSDTLETLLDLSVDVGRCDTLGDALKKFSTVEKLEGKNKYKCEKCNKPVNASKQITVHKAPQALCIHLKRFTPWGRKLTHQVEYPSKLSIQDVMSDGQKSPVYRLYGIILHAGGTPNSGHYYAFVQNSSGQWSKMNDEEITDVRNGPPYDHKNAYMLFYMREPSSLDDVVAQATAPAASPNPNSYKVGAYTFHAPPKTALKAPPKPSIKTSKPRVIHSDDEEDTGKPVSPSSPTTSKSRLKSPRSGDDMTNPSPCKKPRIDDDSSNKENGAPVTKPVFSYANAAKPTKAPTRPLQKLDLRNVSSEPEDQDETQITVDATQPPESQMTQDTQMTLNTDSHSPSLPVSREPSPEPTSSKPRAWQMDDRSATPPTPTRPSSPPASSFVSSSASTKQEFGADDMEEEPTSTIPRNAWTSTEPRAWTSGGASGVTRSKPTKTYQSSAKKEQRRGHNPYGFMGIPEGSNSGSRPQNGGGIHNGATIGKKKSRRPGGV